MRRPAGAFTLLELLVSMALVGIVAVVSFSIMDATSRAWAAHKARLSAFGDTRVVFEALTQRLAQATLNTYWDYDNRGKPEKYLRRSELHYVQGKGAALLPGISDVVTDAVFFVAPLGINENAAYNSLTDMLTACGFYVKFSGQPNRPAFVADKVPERHRYRLYQVIQPGEQLEIYSSADEKQWFRRAAADWSFPMADNVIGLILRAGFRDGATERTVYDYDSRDLPVPAAPPPTYNQLPPVVSATLVVIDEKSARQLEAVYQDQPPPIQPSADAFKDPDKYDSDLNDWRLKLDGIRPKITYRVLTSDIAIQGAKWSSDQP